MKRAMIFLFLGMMVAAARIAMAQDSVNGTSVAGRISIASMTGGQGVPSQGSSRTSPTSAIAGGLGVGAIVGSGGTGPGTNDGSHSLGVASNMTAGKGGNTMDAVPGRAPTYVNDVGGKGFQPVVGGVGR